jgi:hypothetical protein
MDTSKLVPRIIGAFTFKTAVYDDVENDESFTQMAYIIVAVVAILKALPVLDIAGIIVSIILAIVGFFVMAWVISAVGKAVFKAPVSTAEMIRTLGLAYVWNIVGILGFIPCLGALAIFIASILGLVASFIAAKAALDLDWVQTLVTVFIGWLVMMVIVFIGGAILAAIGIGAGLATGAFGS